MTLRRALMTVVVGLVGCSSPEVRIGAGQGIPSVTGSTEVELDTFTCGMPIDAGEYQVTTRTVGADCELSFDRDVQVIKQSDYANIPDFAGSSLVQAVDLEVRKLAFIDSASGQAIDINTRVTSAELKVNGQLVANKAAIATLPVTVRLEGSALEPIKAKIDARQPASVRVSSVVVIKLMPKPPAKMKIDYDAQPTIVLGAGF